ncbi:MAG TPA: energy transducer TonB [Pyrinomonadaceae bacterium]|nr:energy transducer TonB [Pyrinomonadaceae bacterium]
MRQLHLKSRLVFLSLILTICAAPALTQTSDWERLSPEGEEFTVQMPKGSTFESSKEPYHKMELNTRTYISKGQPGPVFAVVSLSGIKSNPAMYTEMQRINSYVDAFKTIFSPKVRKDAVVKLVLVGDKTLQGNPGREYRLTIGDLTGTAQVFATRKRFYSIVFLNTKKDDAVQEEFLSSFVLPEKIQSEQPAAQPAIAIDGGATASPAEARSRNAEAAPAEQANGAGEVKPDGTPGKRGPISAGVLNGKAISLPRPEHPAEAKDVEGVVVVQVMIDEQGNVTDARAVSGPAVLQAASTKAAFLAKFTPTLLSGEPVKVTGVLVYNFGRPQS